MVEKYGVVAVVDEFGYASLVRLCEYRIAVASRATLYIGVVSDSLSAVSIEPHVGTINDVAWSPDCMYTAVAGSEGLAIIDVNANAVLSSVNVVNVERLAWGDRLYAVSGNALHVFDSPPLLQGAEMPLDLDKVFDVDYRGRVLGLRNDKLVLLSEGEVVDIGVGRVDYAALKEDVVVYTRGRSLEYRRVGGEKVCRIKLYSKPCMLRVRGDNVILGFDDGGLMVFTGDCSLYAVAAVEGKPHDAQLVGDRMYVAAGRLYVLERGKGVHPRRLRAFEAMTALLESIEGLG